MNNSAWQKHGVCAMETSLQRKAGALLMRLRDARRGSLPLNLGHWELSKVFELCKLHDARQRESARLPRKVSQQRRSISLRSLSGPPQHTLSLVSPFVEGADTCGSAPLSAVHHLGGPSLLVSTYF